MSKKWIIFDAITQIKSQPLNKEQLQASIYRIHNSELKRFHIWTVGWSNWQSLENFLNSDQSNFFRTVEEAKIASARNVNDDTLEITKTSANGKKSKRSKDKTKEKSITKSMTLIKFTDEITETSYKFGQQAFDGEGRLADQATVAFLEQCFADFADFVKSSQSASTSMIKGDSTMSLTDSTHWDATYDVIVLGFGGAGATAARFAADAGAKVLLVDSAPEGHEGGNTRVSGQLVCSTDDEDAMRVHYHGQTAPMDLDDDIVNTYVEGMANMKQRPLSRITSHRAPHRRNR